MPNSVAGGARPAATSPTPGPLKILDLTFGPQQASGIDGAQSTVKTNTVLWGDLYLYLYIIN